MADVRTCRVNGLIKTKIGLHVLCHTAVTNLIAGDCDGDSVSYGFKIPLIEVIENEIIKLRAAADEILKKMRQND